MKYYLKKYPTGFTLVELLVVIAIIGLLASFILISINSARMKARDARIIGEMAQLRNVAGIIYADDKDYDCLCASSNPSCGNGCNQDIISLADDINNINSGADLLIVRDSASNSQEYCAVVELNRGGYCIDSSGIANPYVAQSRPSCSVDTTCP